jgi:hypothetical protein
LIIGYPGFYNRILFFYICGILLKILFLKNFKLPHDNFKVSISPNEVVETDLDQSNCGLIISILSDPAPKARNLAVEVLRHFIQQCKQFISKVCTTRRSEPNFISLGESVNISIERLHYLLIFALQKEFKRNPSSNQEIMVNFES